MCLMKVSLVLNLRKRARRIVAVKVVRCLRTPRPCCPAGAQQVPSRWQLGILSSAVSRSLSYLRKVVSPYTKHHDEKD